MRHPVPVLSVVLAIVAASTMSAHAALLWDESPSADGDLADTSFSPPGTLGDEIPTDVGTLSGGTHNLIGFTATPPTDDDGFRFTVPTGETLTALSVDLDGRTFLRLTDETGDPLGDFATGDPVFNNGNNAAFNLNVLSYLNVASLGEGTYVFVLRNGRGGTSTVNYEFHFTATPEPAALGLLGAGALLMLRRRGRA